LLHGKSYTSVCRTRDNPFQKFSVPTRIPQYISCASPGKNRQDGYAGHFTHSFVHPAFKKSTHGVLPFTEEECILLMSIKPREYLPLWQSDNFCQHVQKSVQQLLSRMRENEGAPTNQPVVAICIKQAAILRAPAFQAGCRGFEPRLPLPSIDRLCAGRSQAAWR
jgi:hypothetical protein